MRQYPTSDRWYAIAILCVNAAFLAYIIYDVCRTAKTLAGVPEELRRLHRAHQAASLAGFTLIATVPALLMWAGLLPSVGTSVVSVWVLLGFNALLGRWVRTRKSAIRAREKG